MLRHARRGVDDDVGERAALSSQGVGEGAGHRAEEHGGAEACVLFFFLFFCSLCCCSPCSLQQSRVCSLFSSRPATVARRHVLVSRQCVCVSPPRLDAHLPPDAPGGRRAASMAAATKTAPPTAAPARRARRGARDAHGQSARPAPDDVDALDDD